MSGQPTNAKKRCPHDVLAYGPGSNAGVQCVDCGAVWRRTVEWIGNQRISRLVRVRISRPAR